MVVVQPLAVPSESIDIDLELAGRHAARVAISIRRDIHLTEWPACTFVAGAIKEVHSCCTDSAVKELILEGVEKFIQYNYPALHQILDVSTALKHAEFHPSRRLCSASVLNESSEEQESNERSREPVSDVDSEELESNKKSRESESAAKIALLVKKLAKKIKTGITEIQKRGSNVSSPDLCTGYATDEPNQVLLGASLPETSYDDIRQQLEEEAGKYAQRGITWRLLAWCSSFSAGTLDSMIKYLPARRVGGLEAIEVDTGAGTQRSTSKRRRDYARLVNSIVYGLPDRPLVIYLALAVKSYHFSTRVPLSEHEYGLIASGVIEQLMDGKVNLTLTDDDGAVYDPVRHLCQRTDQSFDTISQGFRRSLIILPTPSSTCLETPGQFNQPSAEWASTPALPLGGTFQFEIGSINVMDNILGVYNSRTRVQVADQSNSATSTGFRGTSNSTLSGLIARRRPCVLEANQESGRGRGISGGCPQKRPRLSSSQATTGNVAVECQSNGANLSTTNMGIYEYQSPARSIPIHCETVATLDHTALVSTEDMGWLPPDTLTMLDLDRGIDMDPVSISTRHLDPNPDPFYSELWDDGFDIAPGPEGLGELERLEC